MLHVAKFHWTPNHQAEFINLKGTLIHVATIHYPDLQNDVVYTNNSDDICGAQLLQGHNGQELSVAFLSHTFTDTQQKMEHS